MKEEFNLLEEYSKCIQECLKNILHDYSMAKDSTPIVIYATSPVAYAKAQEHFANGQNVGPLITFYQSGIEIDHSQQMGAWHLMPVQRKQGNYLFKAPIICKINYTVTINALTELEADMLQIQIMQATPFHRPYYTKFNGQFVLIESDNSRNLSSVDTGENKDKFSRRELTLTIDRAYIYYDNKELNAGKIVYEENEEELIEGEEYTELKNGVKITKDGRIIDGKIIPNSSNDGYSPFNYNVVDENDNVVDVVQKGKTKITMYQIDGVN